jgi:hypothetical protein
MTMKRAIALLGGLTLLPETFGLTGRWMAAGGRCVLGENGKIEMTVESSSGGSD